MRMERIIKKKGLEGGSREREREREKERDRLSDRIRECRAMLIGLHDESRSE